MIKKAIHKIEKKCVGLLSHFSVKLSSRYLYIRSQKKPLHLNNPKTFNEKLMWIKINCYLNNSLIWKCVDKYEVRKFLLSKGVKEQYLPRLINTYETADIIDFSSLPNKFALKCTHGCGFNIICHNKKELDYNYTIKQLNKWLKTKFGYETAETQYVHQKPVIICEEYIDSNVGLPYDYKIYCFNGVAKCCLACSNREEKLNLNFYDLNWNELPLGKENLRNTCKIERPKYFDQMIELAEMCSKEFPFVRVDFYDDKSTPIIGELTFTPAACVADYYTSYGQVYLSSFIDINNIKNRIKK